LTVSQIDGRPVSYGMNSLKISSLQVKESI